MNRNEESLREIWDTIECVTIYMMGVAGDERKEKKKYSKK